MTVFSPSETALLPWLVTRYINLSACIWVQGTLRFLVWSFMRTFPSASPSLCFMLIENILFFMYNSSVTILQLYSASAWCTMHKTGLPYYFWNHTHLKKKSYGSPLSHSATLTGFTGLNQACLGGILKTNIGLSISVWTRILLCGAHESDILAKQCNKKVYCICCIYR